VSWAPASVPGVQLKSVASSADGTRLVAVGDGFWTSSLRAVSGNQGSSEQFQYLGSGAWQRVQPNGAWSLFGTNLYFIGGGVGIGTPAPQQSLSVVGGVNLDQNDQNTGTLGSDALTFGSDSGEGIASDRANNGSQYDLEFYTAYQNRIEILHNGNVGIGNNNPGHLLVVGNGASPAYCDGTTWQNGSDRHAKDDFGAVDPRAVLDQVAALPITQWRYKTDASGLRHLGPMAQDFHAAFGLNGADDQHIATVDEGGVALAAIQGLNQKLTEELKRRDAENAELKQELDHLKRLVDSLAHQASNRGEEP
jgi:hypothetical protein